MGPKNNHFLGKIFSFNVNSLALIFSFLVRKSMSGCGALQSPFLKLATFLSAKGEYKFDDSKNGYRVT